MSITGRASILSLVGALHLALLAAPVQAQRLRTTPLAAVDTVLFARVALDAPPAASLRRAPGTGRTVIGTVGGAVVGAFLGYFASQVIRSDWEDEAGTESANRRAFAIGGATLGAVAGYAIMRRQTAGAEDRRPGNTPPSYEGVDLEIIVRNEIVASGATNAYDLVQARRPRWLSTRGVNTFRESGKVVAVEDRSALLEKGADETIVVYLDQARLGGVEELREIPTSSVVAVRFLDAREASFRFGSGHDHGAIIVLTR